MNGNALVQFQEDTPAKFDSLVLISGLAPGEVVMSIDGRPGTGQLLALAVNPAGGATDGKLYWVDPDTGAATPTGTPTFDVDDTALRTTIDINPTVDRLRVVGTDRQNLRVNPNNGALAVTDTDLVYPSLPVGLEPVVSIAYDRNVAASAAGGITTLYGISQSGSLVTIGGVNSTPSPNLGQVFAVGALGVSPDDEHIGFDITAQNNAYASMTVGGDTGLYSVNLATGAAALVGNIGNGDLAIRDLAVEIQVDDAASQYTSLASPARLVDTRLGSKVGPGGTLVVGVAGTNGIPANATAAVLNVTVTQPDAGGFTTVYPTGSTLPTTSTVNVDGPGQTRAAFATVPLGIQWIGQCVQRTRQPDHRRRRRLLRARRERRRSARAAHAKPDPRHPQRHRRPRWWHCEGDGEPDDRAPGHRPRWRAGDRPRQPDERVGRDRQRDGHPDHGTRILHGLPGWDEPADGLDAERLGDR